MTEKEVPPPRLVKDPKKRGGTDSLDVEGREFFRQFEADIADLKQTDAALQVLLRRRVVSLDEPVSLALEKMNERAGELEETLEALEGRRGPIQKRERDEVDDDFEKIMDEDEDEARVESEHLEVVVRVIGLLLNAGLVKPTDTFIRAVEALSIQIKKITP